MSGKRMFIVAIDPLDAHYDVDQLRELMRNSRVFASWWHHIPGCFLITSEFDANAITDEIRSVTGDARLLVMASNPAQSEGWLPPRSWEWIRRREPEQVE